MPIDQSVLLLDKSFYCFNGELSNLGRKKVLFISGEQWMTSLSWSVNCEPASLGRQESTHYSLTGTGGFPSQRNHYSVNAGLGFYGNKRN